MAMQRLKSLPGEQVGDVVGPIVGSCVGYFGVVGEREGAPAGY